MLSDMCSSTWIDDLATTTIIILLIYTYMYNEHVKNIANGSSHDSILNIFKICRSRMFGFCPYPDSEPDF